MHAIQPPNRNEMLILLGILLLAVIASVMLCCSTPPMAEQITEYDELVHESVANWLDDRMWDEEWEAFSEVDAAWRDAEDLEDLYTYFSTEFDWDLHSMVERIRRSQFRVETVTEEYEFQEIMFALNRYVYLPIE